MNTPQARPRRPHVHPSEDVPAIVKALQADDRVAVPLDELQPASGLPPHRFSRALSRGNRLGEFLVWTDARDSKNVKECATLGPLNAHRAGLYADGTGRVWVRKSDPLRDQNVTYRKGLDRNNLE
jgi:hypothetical protein